MITKFKLYEELKKEPQTGDYVICHHKYWSASANAEFLANIGQIKYPVGGNKYEVRYDTLLKNTNERNPIGRNEWIFFKDEILYYSKNRKDLEPIAQFNSDSNKFGL